MVENNSPEEDEISLLDLAQTIAENLRLLVLGPLAFGVFALGVCFLVTPDFTAKTVIMPPQQQQSAAANILNQLGALGGLAGGVAGLKNPNDQYVGLLQSVSLQDALINRFDLKQRYDKEFMVKAREVLTKNVKVTSNKEGTLQIEVDDEDPQFAATLANAHVEELSRLMARLAMTEAQQRRLFFERHLQEATQKLAAAQTKLAGSGVSAALLKNNPAAAMAAVSSLRAQITSQEVKIGALRGYLADTAPELKLAMKDLDNLRQQLRRQESSGLDAASIDPSKPGYDALYRDYKYQETLVDMFAKQFEAAKIDESREGAVIQVVDHALPPELKSKPKKALIAVLATLASGFALLLFVFVRQGLRNASQDKEAAQKIAAIRVAWKRAIGKA